MGDEEEFTEPPIGDYADNSQNHHAINNHHDQNGDADGLADESSAGCLPTLHRISRSLSDIELSRHSSGDGLQRRLRPITVPLHQVLPRPTRREPNHNVLQQEEEGSLEERPDTTKMQAAIQSGKMEPVHNLLRGMTDRQQKAQLCATYRSPDSPDKNGLHVRTGPMLHAVQCGNSGAFSALLRAARGILKPQLKEMIKATDGIDRTVLAMAASSGKRGTFETVLAAVKNELDPIEVSAMMRAKDSQKRSLLALATESTDEDTFRAVLESLERELSEEEMYDLIAPEEYLGNKLLLQAVKSDKGKDLGLLKAVLKAVGRCFDCNDVPQLVLACVRKSFRGQELLHEAIRCCEIDLFHKTPDFVKEHLADRKAAKEISTIFSKWAGRRVWMEQVAHAVKKHTQKKIEKFFQNLLSGNKLLDWVKTCLSGPLVSTKNPFVHGLTLSLAFSRAAEKAPEGERRNLLYLQQTIDEFLLEVLERLPQTVRGCKGRMNCSALFEPTHLGEDPSPLQMMMGKRKQRLIFCRVPLVLDYLSVRFSRGLSVLLDRDSILGDKEVLRGLADTNVGSVLGFSGDLGTPFARAIASHKSSLVFLVIRQVILYFRHLWVLLQGPNIDFPCLAGIPIVGRCPGLQFITAGIVARPGQYYRVPVLRMVLEFVVYVAMLVVFSIFVLLYPDGELTRGEVIFFVSFVAAGALREVREMVRDLEAYFEDRWNILDVLSLALLLGGFIVRSIDSASPWGRALYALSAPLVFSRVLFFAQILPFQGPMIQVIFSMTAELIQFGVVMVLMMLGFVMAFFALFQDDDTFGQTWLNLFKAMLGEVGLFDDFGEQIQDHVATALLIVYLIIMSIMLLNLLIAVLSTAHSKVEENAEREFKVSKARVIQHYEMTVKNELLPAPFSLVQLALSWMFSALYTSCQHFFANHNAEQVRRFETAARQVFGQAVFWLVLGPVAVMVGILLWILSAFYAPYAWTNYYIAQSGPVSTLQLYRRIVLLALQWIVIIVWCGLVAPLCLVVMWFVAPLWSGLTWLNVGSCRQENHLSYKLLVWPSLLHVVGASDSFDVDKMLRNAPGGVGARDLFAYLVDPMNDPEVRQDETNRRTTVKHIKFLRNRLEKTAEKQIDELRMSVGGKIDELRKETRQREQKLEQKLDEAMQVIEETRCREQTLEQKLDRLEKTAEKQIDELRTSVGGKIDELRKETRQREQKLEQKLDEAMQVIEETRCREQTLEQKLDKVMLILGNVDLILRDNIRSAEPGQAPSS